ncbi:MAG: hypothetical protein JNM57_14890 [Cyclobacteriaceae bacterium]|nr:hypothetical protein [Cyclobacteriaceae bacterium]
MIYFVLSRRNSGSIKNFLRSGGEQFEGRIKIILWESMEALRTIRAGTFIFSDLDLLSPEQREIAREIGCQLRKFYPHVQLINDPATVLLRYDLLKKMYEDGINRFNVARATESLTHLRFPVFVRQADRHTGPLTKLIDNLKDLERNIRMLNFLGYPSHDLLVIEFLDTSGSAGYFVKYSAFVLGNRVMPRYLNYGTGWMVKSTIGVSDTLMKSKQMEVEEFMRDNPHEQWLRQIFTLSGIRYGRADYAMVDGTLQLWEINLNPVFVRPPRDSRKDSAQQRHMREAFYSQFIEALQEIDSESDEMIQLKISDSALATMRFSLRRKLTEKFHNRLVKKKIRYRILHSICFGLARLWTKFF